MQEIVDTGLDVGLILLTMTKNWEFLLPQKMSKMFSVHAFEHYLVKLYEYLQVLENRLFSSGLHTLGEPPNEEELTGYLNALF